ncbi:peptidoglycan-binding protein [Streptomyces sp. NPDC007971]|uniref:peptidoglycan-binding domain-containing protein n=1 Tax=Streptomyces sp. NPDC007971 TaxID=3364799 RepID=UPI0036E23F0B
MRHTRILRRATVTLAAAVTMGLGTTTAHADPGIPNVGYGYPNPGESVRCVQFFVNNYLNLHLLEDGKFGPQTEYGVRQLQRLSNFNWATHELAIDGIFGKATGEVVLDHVKRYPWTIDYARASHCAHYVPSYSVILN